MAKQSPQHLDASQFTAEQQFSADVVIIGSGHAGYGLAQALRKAAPQLEIRVLTQESGHLYSKPALSIALAQGRTAAALATETPLAIEQRLGIRIYTGCKVERIDAQAQRLYTSLGEMDYGQLVLASGASPVRLPIEGRAEAQSRDNKLQTIVPNLVEAMFTDFPGRSGETKRISVAPENMPVQRNQRR